MNLLSKIGFSAAAFFLAASVAEAGPLTGTFNLTIYQATCGGCTISSPGEQAQLGNPFITPADEVAAGTYVGQLNWSNNGSGTGSLQPYIDNGTGTFTPSFEVANFNTLALSSASFDLTTVFVITGNLGGSVLSGNIQHDDGMDLYDGGTGFATLVADSHTPTSEIPTPYSGVTGNFGVVYVEANGLPADFIFNVTSRVPEPLTLSLFGAMLAGAAAGFRRRQKKATHA